MALQRKTMKTMVTCAAMLLAVAYGMSASTRISLKLCGGVGGFHIGDTNDNISDLVRQWENVANQSQSGLNGTLKTMGFGVEGEAEILVRIKPFLGVSLGLGRISIQKNGNRMEMTLPPPVFHQIQAEDNRITATPVTLNVYYFKPVFASGTLYVKAGAGVYFTKWWEHGRYDQDTETVLPWWREWDLEAKASGLGVQGSIGFEYALTRWLSICVEGQGRYCKISGFKGDTNIFRSYSGYATYSRETLYYYQWWDPGTPDWYSDVNLRVDAPGGANERNGREAVVDLSGVGVKLGFIIRLM